VRVLVTRGSIVSAIGQHALRRTDQSACACAIGAAGRP
jgi:hypothetical protein